MSGSRRSTTSCSRPVARLFPADKVPHCADNVIIQH
ncbi:hypothetical protein PIIN_11302 [Serendipita indica DSM 11827]|uniref:Uncharacterized protein n=1 Tax=Serendipita indica (strain DSM 11827) TaxID=1109443 RepID=G4U182_SERID|nr:hypothetical protein PIIN_11302 [Serendipita indica DSM 11827]